jgi:hypothetical protein
MLALQVLGPNELERAAGAGNELSRLYAGAQMALPRQAGIRPAAIGECACHGQTIRYRPAAACSSQIGNPALLAESTGMRGLGIRLRAGQRPARSVDGPTSGYRNTIAPESGHKAERYSRKYWRRCWKRRTLRGARPKAAAETCSTALAWRSVPCSVLRRKMFRPPSPNSAPARSRPQ